MGAPFESGPNHEYRGAAYVFSGGTGELLRTFYSRRINFAPGQFGHSVGAAGPTSPSRRGVVLVGDRYAAHPLPDTNRGAAYAYLFCRADADADGRINSNDISRFLSGWIRTVGSPPGTLPPPGVHHGDFDGDGQVTPADISEFLNQWLQAVSAGGCL